MNNKHLIYSIILLLSIEPASAQWGPIKKIKQLAGDAANIAVKPITLPTQTVVKAAQAVKGQSKPGAILEPYKQLLKTGGNLIKNTNDLYKNGTDFAYQKARQIAEKGGKPGLFLFDIGTFSQSYMNELSGAGVQNIGAILQGQNILHITATPLAAAIREAREAHFLNSRPIPDDVKNGLRNYFPASTLNRARYAVGKIEITLPNFIGQSAAFMGSEYAVTADDIIVFNTPPPNFNDGINWWAHEMTHVNQYEQMGVETFAFNYLKDMGRTIEGQAIGYAAQVNDKITNNGNNSLVVNPIEAGNAAVISQAIVQNYNNQQQNEYYTGQCFFLNNQSQVNYLLTSYGRIIAVDPLTNESAYIGIMAPPPPNLPGFVWSFQAANDSFTFGVFNDGKIVKYSFLNGQIIGFWPQQIGYVISFNN